MMTSSIAVLQKFTNAIFTKTGQSESLSKLVNSLKRKKSKTLAPTDKQISTNAEKASSSPRVSLKESAKPNATASTTQETYVIDNRFLDNFEKDENTEIFIIYLNRPFDLQTLRSLHKISSYTVMADGAANRFHDKFVDQPDAEEIIPHALVGDFDSIRQDVMGYYKDRNVNVFHDRSQDDTDLEKCLRHIQSRFDEEGLYDKNKTYRIIITGGFGGRMDHTLNNIHILHKFAEKYTKQTNISLHLVDNNSVGTCILPGKTTYIRSKHFEQDAGCGMFPLLGVEAKVQTKGLKWDVGQDCPALSFKKFVSSSNEMLGEVVEFETDSIIFWTTTNTIHGKKSDE